MTYPEETDSGGSSLALNQHDQKVDTVHESITQGGKLLAPCDPVALLIRATNLPDGQIIEFCREGDLYINNSLYPCLHLISFIQQKARPHGCMQQSRDCNAWMKMNLSRWTFSFSASSVPLICFFTLLFRPPFLTHSGRLVIAFLFLSLSRILNLPHSHALLAENNR